jgi:hypothetical protein
MNLVFERGDRSAPSGHALVYFRTGNDAVYAAYIIIPPIAFDPTEFTPPALAPLLANLDLGAMSMATPIPPIPQEVAGGEYLMALAERRNDDLIFAGSIVVSSPAMLIPEMGEAASQYNDLYRAAGVPDATPTPIPAASTPAPSRYDTMSEGEKINELTSLTGQLRDTLTRGRPDTEVLDAMRDLTASLPAKYRGSGLIRAAQQPGERGQHLAELYLERCYKLLREDYLDLERIDREIEALGS